MKIILEAQTIDNNNSITFVLMSNMLSYKVNNLHLIIFKLLMSSAVTVRLIEQFTAGLRILEKFTSC